VLRSSVKKTANIPYIGRFAPSPTGPLHFGSLLAALASYLDAKIQNGQWLIRIEDLDPPREMAGAKDLILKALDVYGLHSDQDIIYQSDRSKIYQEVLDQLIKSQQVFPCACSRKQLAVNQGIHFGRCNSVSLDAVDLDISTSQSSITAPYAWRFDSKQTGCIDTVGNISFLDELQGLFSQSIELNIGDFVVKRKELLWAYQLAMVVDDQHQGVTHVVRGIDLIDSTLRQNMLQASLNYSQPHYAHIPVACAPNGQKLSKQNLAPALDLQQPAENLWRALSWLGQKPPENLRKASVKEVLAWGVEHWDIKVLSDIQSQAAI
jgi:glutamyl-Q tRNA(Asp) synthetase